MVVELWWYVNWSDWSTQAVGPWLVAGKLMYYHDSFCKPWKNSSFFFFPNAWNLYFERHFATIFQGKSKEIESHYASSLTISDFDLLTSMWPYFTYMENSESKLNWSQMPIEWRFCSTFMEEKWKACFLILNQKLRYITKFSLFPSFFCCSYNILLNWLVQHNYIQHSVVSPSNLKRVGAHLEGFGYKIKIWPDLVHFGIMAVCFIGRPDYCHGWLFWYLPSQ